MQYIFGYKEYNGKQEETVKTIGDHYTNLKDFNEYTYSNNDETIHHSFRVYFKFKECQNEDGDYCTYYYIDNHFFTIDKSNGINRRIDLNTTDIQNNTDAIEEIILTLLNE